MLDPGLNTNLIKCTTDSNRNVLLSHKQRLIPKDIIVHIGDTFRKKVVRIVRKVSLKIISKDHDPLKTLIEDKWGIKGMNIQSNALRQ